MAQPPGCCGGSAASPRGGRLAAKGSRRSIGFVGAAVIVITAATLLTWLIMQGSFGSLEPEPGSGSDASSPTGTATGQATEANPPAAVDLQLRPVLVVAPISSAGSALPSSGSVDPTSASDLAWIDPDLAGRFSRLSTCSGEAEESPQKPLLTCRDSQKYLLGPAEVSGAATAGARAVQALGGAGWVVEVTLKPDAAKALAVMTTRLVNLETSRNSLAILAGGRLLGVAMVMEPITGGVIQVAGGYTQEQARALASSLGSIR
jgi:preprotein translocase subunit SecD